MEWLTCVKKTINIIEEDLTKNVSVQDIAKQLYISPFLLNKGFSIMTGYTIMEYARYRKLYQSALDLRESNVKIIDIAFKYGYETPESFTKAFIRFHGVSPSKMRSGANPKPFLPLKINVTISGGSVMKVKIAKTFSFKLIGFPKLFNCETAFEEIPKFWDELCEKYANNIYAGNPPANAYEKAIMDNCIGEYAVCIDNLGQDGNFLYMVAGKYTGGEVPEGMKLYEFPGGDWAIFDCFGPNPQTLQNMTTRVFKEWLPANPDYEISGDATIEWYDCTVDQDDPDYHSAIWIPVKKKVK